MTTFEVLSSHKTIAVFDGIQHQPCRFLTSLCPDKCDHATDSAVFTVEKYLSYEQNGEYGDEQQTKIYCTINKSVHYQDKSITTIVKTLQVGKKYYVDYDHIYITDETGNKYPARPVKRIEEVK